MSAATDKVIVSGIECVASIGVTRDERATKQRLSIDVEVTTDTRRAAETDSLKDAVDYSPMVMLVVELAGSQDFHLIETLAEEIADRVLAECGGESVRVVVRKMTPPFTIRLQYVAVEIVRNRSSEAAK